MYIMICSYCLDFVTKYIYCFVVMVGHFHYSQVILSVQYLCVLVKEFDNFHSNQLDLHHWYYHAHIYIH